jgi:hypothetical protein
MTELARDAAIDAAELLTHYSFDLGGFTVERLIDYWLREYPANWLRPALVEALYQGRYKAVSVTQILTLWKRRGQPLYHFNHEFERMVCGKFPRTPNAPSEPIASSRSAPSSSLSGDRPAAALPLRNPEVTELQLFEDAIAVDQPSETGTADAATGSEPTDAKDDAPSEQPPEPETRRSPDTGDRPIRALLPAAKSSVEPPPPSSGRVPPDASPTAIPESPVSAESVEARDEPLPAAVSIQPTGSEAKTDSPIPTFKPVSAGLDAAELVQWAGDRVSKHPIHQFVPSTGVSNFYTKLKAVVQSRDDYFTDLALAGDSISLPEQRERE